MQCILIFSHVSIDTFVMNLMFDFDISLFMLNTWMTITSYVDSSHVPIEFQCLHPSMTLLRFLVWRTKVGIRTRFLVCNAVIQSATQLQQR